MADAIPDPGRVLDSLRLDGKRALVTGAGRGIGRACAEALASAGAHVILTARSDDELTAVAEAIHAAGGSAETDPRDLGAMAAIRGLADHGPVDILVSNAGINRPQPVWEVSEENFDAIVGLNLRSAFFVAQTVAQGMIAAGRGGSIITMSSQMGHVGGQNRSVYCASKHAVEGFTKAMALDLAAHRIRANTVCPTFIRTPMTAPFFENADFRADTLGRIPLGRVGEVGDVVGAVLLLASDAGALITGTSIRVDGGWTAV